MQPGTPPDKGLAKASGRAYEAIWRWAGSWYAGVNAAAMALVAGDGKTAKGFAARF